MNALTEVNNLLYPNIHKILSMILPPEGVWKTKIYFVFIYRNLSRLDIGFAALPYSNYCSKPFFRAAVIVLNCMYNLVIEVISGVS